MIDTIPHSINPKQLKQLLQKAREACESLDQHIDESVNEWASRLIEDVKNATD